MSHTRERSARAGAPKLNQLGLSGHHIRGSRNESVYQAIRSAIEGGDLKPGQRVMEVEIGDALGVSRTPVREALRRLETEGIVVVEPRVGLVVASLDPQAVMELYEIREVLEAKAAALCATHATDLEIATLRELVSREQRLRDPDELARHNRVFHEAVHQGAHNRYLTRTLSTLNDSMWLLGPSLMRLTERARTALKDHAVLFAAIEKRDAKAAEAAARAHVRGAKQQRLRTLFPRSAPRETV